MVDRDEPFTATEMHEQLDRRGLLDHAQGPATYGLEVTVPDDPDAVAAAFVPVTGHEPPADIADQLAAADNCAYVGASLNAYERLEDHVIGTDRRATFVKAFDIERVIGVWPTETPFEDEFTRAQLLAATGWRVWTDGELL
jgi:hypothetical protein